MNPNLIFVPVAAQALLTCFIWFWMYFDRISLMFKKGIKTQDLADGDYASKALKAADNSSDNLENLFEIPMLFFVAALVIHATRTVDPLYVKLLSTFVALRLAHSIIHCTYNRVIHRFTTYAVSTLILWVVWARIGAQLIAGL